MKLCFPVEKNDGLESRVFGHFGSAPVFVVVDTESRVVTEVINRDLHHAHGSCNPLRALGGETIDAVVVGGIGGGALMGLNRAGIRVLRALEASISANLEKTAQLPELTPAQVCGGHGHGQAHGCAH